MEDKKAKITLRLANGKVVEIEVDEASVARTIADIERNLSVGESQGEPKRTTATPSETKDLSLADALRQLIQEGFFEGGRTIDEIGEALGRKGIDVSGRKLSGVALVLGFWFKRGLYGLRRDSLPERIKLAGGKGSWRYYAPARSSINDLNARGE